MGMRHLAVGVMLMLSSVGFSQQLYLHGTISSSKQDQGMALFMDHNGKIQIYQVGQGIDLYEGFIYRVERSQVLVQTPSGLKRVLKGSSQLDSLEARATPTRQSERIEVATGIQRYRNHIKVNAALRRSLVEEKLAEVLMQAGTQPVSRNGQIVGFEIYEIDKGSIYDLAGFRDGDIITHINEIPLNGVANAVRMLRSLKEAEELRVTYQRGGVSTDLKISVI